MIKIYPEPNFSDLGTVLKFSDGTRLATLEDTEGEAYESEARIPRTPWRSPTSQELELIWTNKPPYDYSRSIALLSLPRPTSYYERELIRKNDPQAIERWLFAPLLDICVINEPIICLGTTENPPNLNTTTIDPHSGERIGLHVDSWFGPPRLDHKTSPNRVSINIGDEPRHFLFLPLPVMEMAMMLQSHLNEVPIPWNNPTQLGRLFMQYFPNFPVISCELSPFEAYVAPTENIVHDGSSIGCCIKDQHYTLLGHVRPRIRIAS